MPNSKMILDVSNSQSRAVYIHWMKTEILLLVLCGGEFGWDWQWKWYACDDVVKCENKPQWL